MSRTTTQSSSPFDVKAEAKITAYLRKNPGMYTSQIAPAVGIPEEHARKLLHEMERAGKVMQDEPDCWELTH